MDAQLQQISHAITAVQWYMCVIIIYLLYRVQTIDAHDLRMPVIVFRRLDLSSYLVRADLALSIYMPTGDRYLDSLTSGVASMEQLLPRNAKGHLCNSP